MLATTLVLGLGREVAADAYARDGTLQDVSHRRGRDAVRIGELLRLKHDVFSVSLGGMTEAEKHEQHINFDWGVPGWQKRTHGRGRPSFADATKAALNGRKLDYILDEWVWIPVNFPSLKRSFYCHNKWENMLALADGGMLRPGCQLMVPLHINAGLVLFGKQPESEDLWERLCQRFTPSILPLDDAVLCQEHPLWAATQLPSSLTSLPIDDRTYLRDRVANDVSKHPALAERSNLRNELGWMDHTPQAAFLVLTYKQGAIAFEHSQNCRPSCATTSRGCF